MDDYISRFAVRAAFDATGTLPGVVTRREPLMGGHGTITIVGASTALLDETFALALRCESLWSRFLTTSDISLLNWSEGEPVEVDQSTVRLIEAMREGWKLTDGDYDPSLLPDVLAAGYTVSFVDPSRVTVLPSSAVAPGMVDRIRVNGHTVVLPVGTTLDPGGIGKGLAADIACEFAMAEGAWGVMAEFGGDIVVAGRPPDGIAWCLGIEDPLSPGDHCAVIRLARGSLVTSSQRKRRWTTQSGDRHHLIDPRTHTSSSTRVQTVSVIAATGARAEALAKSGFMRDVAKYLEWLPQVGAAGLVTHSTGEISTSQNWSHYL